MPKTITVTDAQGNLLQPTWPKRARGLVKHGRAVFLSESAICLTPPPRQTEEKSMTANDILLKIFELAKDTEHIHTALNALLAMPDKADNGQPGAPPDVAGEAKASAIAETCCAAESTRQQLLAFYIKAYNNSISQPSATDAADS